MVDPSSATASSPPPPEPSAALARPTSPGQLFWACSLLALQGFGGVLAVVQRVLVEERRWLSREGFVEDWAVAQVLPGPNVVNLALMLGDRWFGLRGALAAVLGLLALPLVLLMGLVLLFAQAEHLPAVQGALRGMGAVAAGLIVVTALKLAVALRQHVLGRPAAWGIAALTFALIVFGRVPLPVVLATVGVTSCLWVATRLRPAPSVPPGPGDRAGGAS